MVETTSVQMADHTVEHPGAPSCSCGENLPGGLIAHIATLMDVDEIVARKALLTAHNNVEINAGKCGGCDTCGSDAAMAMCAICGEGYSPCPTYYAAVAE